MRSHSYEFSIRELMSAMAPPLGGLVMMAVILHGMTALQLLPAVGPFGDMDRAVLRHRIETSRQPAGAVLIGDSSCLMGVSARQLGEALQIPVRNLGAVSTLGLDDFGLLAADAVAAAGSKPLEIVLLVHPEFLRRPAADPGMTALFRSLRDRSAALVPGTGLWREVTGWIGADVFQDRVESWVRPMPLPGSFRRRQGFIREFLSAMDADGGGAVDPGQFDPDSAVALPPLAISPRLESAAAAFRSRLPPDLRVRVGVMPVPASLAGPDYANRHARSVEILCGWLGPNAVPLSGLPGVLPDTEFASATHLNEAGRRAFTGRLAEVLRSTP